MSLEADYDALRRGVAGRLVARDVLSVSGPDAAGYLQGQCSQDVEALAPGSAADALLLSPQGKLDALVRVTRRAEDEFVLDTEGGFGAVVAARLERFKLRTKAEITPLTWTCASVRGPAATAPEPSGDVLVVPFAWGGLAGFDLLGPGTSLPDGVPECREEAWEAVRVEAGIPVMGRELDERTIAAEADLLERAVSFTKGCYTGQELVARLDARGNRVARHLRGLVAGQELPVGAELVDAGSGKVVGAVTSSARSPVLGPVALAYVHRDVTVPGAVSVRVGAATVDAEVRLLPLVE
ncbi:MAG: CAF17-like 4Fe-4S cluster assembly/insertion protein YgfZ [Acidimicrobiales bacterium]